MAQERLIHTCPPSQLACLEIFFSDMDGTWLGPEHAPTPGGLQAMTELEEAGLIFAFATGRCVASAEGASGLSLRGRPGVYSNGAVVLGVGGKELYSLDLPAGVIEQSVQLGMARGVSVLLVKLAAT
jgi:hydroxymethylpyrimidine pyrophosphatase-like HAD family hydrolase